MVTHLVAVLEIQLNVQELLHLLKDFQHKLLDEQMHSLSSLSAENQVT